MTAKKTETVRLSPTAPKTAAELLRAFEDQTFGPDAVRIDGHIEDGHGSEYARTDESVKACHRALKHLVAVEAEANKAEKALAEARDRVAVAQKSVEAHGRRLS